MLQYPAQEGGVETGWLEIQVLGVHVQQPGAVLPRAALQALPRHRQLALAEVDTGHFQIGIAPQQDLGLRANAAAHFQQLADAGEIDVSIHHGLGETRLTHQARLLASGKP